MLARSLAVMLLVVLGSGVLTGTTAAQTAEPTAAEDAGGTVVITDADERARNILIAAVLVVTFMGLSVSVLMLYLVLRPRPVHAELVLLVCTDPDPKRRYKGANQFQLRKRTSVIGRSSSKGADIVLDYQPISRIHAEITRRVPGVYMLQDLGSTSGTFTGDAGTGRPDQQFKPHRPLQIKHGDILYFTEYLSFLFRVVGEGDDDDAGHTEAVVVRGDDDTDNMIRLVK